MKICKHCEKEKDFTSFYQGKNICKVCHNSRRHTKNKDMDIKERNVRNHNSDRKKSFKMLKEGESISIKRKLGKIIQKTENIIVLLFGNGQKEAFSLNDYMVMKV